MEHVRHFMLAVLLTMLSGVSSAFAQSDDYKLLMTQVYKTAQFNQLCPQEKVWLHFDNTAYFQGDVIWFSAYVMNATTGQPAPSQVLYVDLVSPTGMLLRQLKLKVVDGRCHGSFPLVDASVEAARELRGVVSYPSGFYEIRAYTLNMLNFDDAGIFSRVLPVYQLPEKEGDWKEAVLNTSEKPWQNSDRPKSGQTETVNVSFFPEGGNLVQGLSCRVAFKATDANGLGIPVIGVVKDEKGDGDDIALLSTAWDGMGYFTFTPTRKRHSVRITYNSKEYTFRLPDAVEEGATLMVDNLSEECIKGKITARVDRKTASRLIGLSLMCRGKVCHFDTLRLKPTESEASEATFAIPRDNMPTGVHQLTLFTPEGEVLAQRQLFINNGIEAASVETTTDREVYAPYDPVSVTLSATSPDGTPLQTSLSVSVRDRLDLGSSATDDVLTDMLLSSELKGCIWHPEWYFSNGEVRAEKGEVRMENGDLTAQENSPTAGNNSQFSTLNSQLNNNSQSSILNSQFKSRALDLLMMTQGWTRYHWRQMAQTEPFAIKHFVEDGLVLDGVLLNRQGKPIADANVTMKLFSPDRQSKQESTVTTDETGRFGFSVEEFEGKWDMFLSARHKEEAVDARMRLDRSSRPELRCYEPIELWMPGHDVIDDAEVAILAPVPKWQSSDPDSVIHLDEVEIEGQRKYIDYMTFKAFDAEEDTEHQLDCGKFSYKVYDYLKEKGYDLDVSGYDGVIPDEIRDRDSFISWSLGQCLLNNHRVLWYLHDEHRNLATTAFTPGFDMDMEDIKSIIVYDSPAIFETLPIVRETLLPEQIMALRQRATINEMPVPAGLYVIDIMMYPTTERRARVKGTRQTSFRGYSELTDFYSPTYPDGPIAGDKDYRRTLYWNPEVQTDESGKAEISFYNNSYSKTFTVSAASITASGMPVMGRSK